MKISTTTKIFFKSVIKYYWESFIHLKVNDYENEILNFSKIESVSATMTLYIFS